MNPENVTSSSIAASAGTGKTYQLSTRFIALLALGTDPGSMIALTFSRKAAGEFRDRILRDLAEGAASEEGANSLKQRILASWRGSSDKATTLPALCPQADEARHPLNQAAFRDMLRSVVSQLSRIRLSTLDSFFNQLVSMSKPELGLSSITLLDDSERRRAALAAFRALFDRINGSDEETEAFLNLYRDITQGKEQNMPDALNQLIGGYKEHYLNVPDTNLWGNTAAFGLPAAPASPLMDEEEREAVAEEIRQLASCLPPSIKKGLRKGFLTFPDKMAKPDLGDSKTVLKALKAAPPPDAPPDYLRLLELCRRLLQDTADRILNEVLARTSATAHLLSVYQGYYEAVVRSRGLLDFGDITRLVPHLLEKEGAATRLAYRLDRTLQHWMLDEFQDTSDAQWRAIRPLVEEIAVDAANARDHAAARSLFIVGDSKQSIYAWRGANSRLFGELTRLSPWQEALQRGEMARSWRSSPVIMDFVNDVFHTRFPESFPEHSTARKEEEYPGLVKVSAEDEIKEGHLGEAVAHVLEELPLKRKAISVGILVRKNEQATEIERYLRQHRPDLPAHIINDVPAGLSSPLGESLYSFFIWLQHPADVYHRAILQTSPLWPILTREKKNPWTYWRQRLEQEGYASLLLTLQSALLRQPHLLTPYHRWHLATWVSAALAFDAKGGSLPEWNRQMKHLTRQENPPRDGIHILTIHKSKGLEYDAVILPLLSSRIDNLTHLNTLFHQDEQGNIDGILHYPGAEKAEFWPALTPCVEAWRRKQLREEENLLYVALTRAARANYILLPPGAKAASHNFSGQILSALGVEEGEAPDFLPLVRGEEHWYDSLPERGDAPLPTLPISLLPARRRRQRRSPSQEEEFFSFSCSSDPTDAPEQVTLADTPTQPTPTDTPAQPTPADTPAHLTPADTPAQLSPTDAPAPPIPTDEEKNEGTRRGTREKARRFGTAVHALLEQIEWWTPDDPPAWYTHPRRPEERLVAQALQDPAFRALFTPAPGDEAFNEQALEALEGSGWISAVLDRIILHADGSAHIIDYKTGHPSADFKRQHLPQMSSYRRLLARALSCPPERIRVTLVSLQPDAVSLHPYSPQEFSPASAASPTLPL